MFKAAWKRSALKGITLILFVLCLLLFSTDSTKLLLGSSQSPQSRAEFPTVSIESQGNSPLRIINTFVESSGSENFVVRLMLQNQGDKMIRAFAVAADNSWGRNRGTSVHLIHLTGSNSILLPTQIKTVDMTYSKDEAPEKVTMSIDFVEFNDGNSWGADLNNSRDKLAGRRQGARVEKLRLKDVLKSKGRSALLSSVAEDAPVDIDSGVSLNRSAEWLHGFRSGVLAIRHRLRQSLQSSNPAQVEIELARPYDTAEGLPS